MPSDKFSLDSLMADLDNVAFAASAHPLAANDFRVASRLAGLPRYSDGGLLAPVDRMLTDFHLAVSRAFLGWPDQDAARATEFVRLYFRIGKSPGDPGKVARYNTIADTLGLGARLVRGELKWKVLAALSYEIFRIGTYAYEPLWHVLGLGYRNVRHDWSVRVDAADLRVEHFRFQTDIEAVRHGQRFVVIGSSLFGGELLDADVESDRLDDSRDSNGDDSYASAQHRYVGHTPVVATAPRDAVLHVVDLGRQLRIGEFERVVVVTSQQKSQDDPLDASGIVCTAASPVDSIRLTAHVPDGLTSSYQRLVRAPGPYESAPEPKKVRRQPGRAMTFEVPEVAQGFTYELAWP